MIPISQRHLTVLPTCDAGRVTFVIVNGETKTATNVRAKRSDGTEHGVATLEPGASLVETVPAPGWVSVWATFANRDGEVVRQWHARVEETCEPPATTTTTPVATTRMTQPPRSTPPRHTAAPEVTVPAELPFTGAGTEATVGAALALVLVGAVLLATRGRGPR